MTNARPQYNGIIIFGFESSKVKKNEKGKDMPAEHGPLTTLISFREKKLGGLVHLEAGAAWDIRSSICNMFVFV
jgi:hypothetical protein